VRPPGRFHQFSAKQFWGVSLDENLRLKIKARRQAEIFMCWPGVAISAAMFAAAVRVYAMGKADVGALIRNDYRSTGIAEKLSAWRRLLIRWRVGVRFMVNRDKAIRRVVAGPPTLENHGQSMPFHANSVHTNMSRCNGVQWT